MQIQSASGTIPIITLEEFVRKIPMKKVRGGTHVRYPVPSSFQECIKSTFDFPEATEMEHGTSVLKYMRSEINSNDLLYQHKILGKYLTDTVSWALFSFISQELKTLIAKTVPNKYALSLNMELITVAEFKLMELGNYSNLSCVIIDGMGERQKYVLMCNNDTFNFFTTEPETLRVMDRDATEIRLSGALATVRPQGMYLIRCIDNNIANLMLELSGKMPYNEINWNNRMLYDSAGNSTIKHQTLIKNVTGTW